jgi:1-acyl-sn-glycerol-3-phosphate acyltransferase
MNILNILYNLYAFILLGIVFFITTILALVLQFLFGKKIWHYLANFNCWIFLKILFLNIQVEGKENIPSGNCIITSNQLSHLDGIVFHALINKKIFAITEPFKKFNFLAVFWMKRLSFVDLRRTTKEDKKYPQSHSRKEGIKLAEKNLKCGKSLLIFPEGHFERDKKLKHFYFGAVKLALTTGVPILPSSIQGTEQVWPADFMLRRPAKIIIKIGKPIKLGINKKPSEKLIKKETIQLKKEIAKLLPSSFKKRGWEKNVKE